MKTHTVLLLSGAAALAVSGHAAARETKTAQTLCRITQTDAEPETSPCTATQTGGAGVSVLTYTVGTKTYHYIQDDGGASFNGENVRTYPRDRNFRITEDDVEKAYFCYRTATVELCSKQ